MSRIYRSRDINDRRVTEVDLRARPMGPQNPHRPVGGFKDYVGESREAPLSQVERMEREALRRVDEARLKVEEIQREAYQAGFEQGEMAGRKLALQKAEPIHQAFAAIIEGMRHDRETLIREHERELIKVAFAMAQRVVQRQIELEPDVVVDVVGAALEKIARSQTVTVCLSPKDRPLIEAELRDGGKLAWPAEHLKLEDDETIERGGCRVETELGDIDATIESQLRALRNHLWDDES